MIRFLWRISTARLNFYGVNSTLRWRPYGVSLGVYGANTPIFGVNKSPAKLYIYIGCQVETETSYVDRLSDSVPAW